MKKKFIFAICLFLLITLAHAQNLGDYAIAEHYVSWAEEAMSQGRWSEALVVLERGSDYADVSSDISYLLALARSHFNHSLVSVLQALRRALATQHWNNYTPQDAHLMEAELFIGLRFYDEALGILSLVDEVPESARLRLLALRFRSDFEGASRLEFYHYTEEAMNRFPMSTGVVRVFLEYLKAEDAKGNYPNERELAIFDLIRRRLPALIPIEGELAWMAAPFLGDVEETRRMVAAYRAIHEADPASIPIALNLGVIDENIALEELFSIRNRINGIDLALMDMIWELLRHDEGRDLFQRYLSSFSGVITSDSDGDGIPEAIAHYANGLLTYYHYDGIQSGIPELHIYFEAGTPTNAILNFPAEAGTGRSVSSIRGEEPRRVSIKWNEYPALMEAELEGERFFFRPFNFFYAPVQFHPFLDILFPEKDPMSAALSRRSLIANSFQIERPSQEFPGAIEIIELNMSIPIRAREFLDGRMISETDFIRGRPIGQRVDLDLDGRLETYRRFRVPSLTANGELPPPEVLLDYQRIFDFVESDWYGDGNIIRDYFP